MVVTRIAMEWIGMDIFTPLLPEDVLETDVETQRVWLTNAQKQFQIECGPMPNVMVALPNIGGALFNAAKFG